MAFVLYAIPKFIFQHIPKIAIIFFAIAVLLDGSPKKILVQFVEKKFHKSDIYHQIQKMGI